MSKFSILFMTVILAGLTSLAQSGQGGAGKQAKPMSRLYGKSGLLLDFGLFYGQTEATANPSALNEWQSTTSVYDVKLGKVEDSGLYWGAEYTVRNDNQILAVNAAGSGAGVGLGYFADNGFNARAFYKFSEKYGDYTDGSGYQADFGYSINMTANFFLGFNISIRQTTFRSNPLIASFDYWTRKETYPFISFGFIFN